MYCGIIVITQASCCGFFVLLDIFRSYMTWDHADWTLVTGCTTGHKLLLHFFQAKLKTIAESCMFPPP